MKCKICGTPAAAYELRDETCINCLKKEVDVLRKEVEVLKKENTSLKDETDFLESRCNRLNEELGI